MSVCVVYEEHTLGYFQTDTIPNVDYVYMGVLAGSVLRGGRNPMNGPVFIYMPLDRDKLRIATKEDFDFFRVCSKGHLE